jgi:hypothetical protein
VNETQGAFSPTLPDDEDGYVPAPGAPSQQRPDYPEDGEPTFRKEDGAPADGEPNLKRVRPIDVEADDTGSDVNINDVVSQPETSFVDPGDPPVTEPAPDESPAQVERIEETQGEEGEHEVEQAEPVPETPVKPAPKGRASRPSSRS